MGIGLWWFDGFVVYEVLNVMTKVYASVSFITCIMVERIVFAGVMLLAKRWVRWFCLL